MNLDLIDNEDQSPAAMAALAEVFFNTALNDEARRQALIIAVAEKKRFSDEDQPSEMLDLSDSEITDAVWAGWNMGVKLVMAHFLGTHPQESDCLMRSARYSMAAAYCTLDEFAPQE
ncbi:MAG: hypothetical protein V3U14_12960 [candidate division NC10 bacterium]